jgi:hypothetical protein
MCSLEASAVGVPFVGGLFTSKYTILDKLPWTSNKAHIVRSLIVSWGFFALVAYAFLYQALNAAGK